MDKETELLSRLAANHLYLAQFEPLRAILLILGKRSPDLALSILQTIVSNSGRFENVLWSHSCASPSLLTFLATIELLKFENPTSPWGFDADILRLRVEFLLLVHVLIDRVTKKDVNLGRIENGNENDEELRSESIGVTEERKTELSDEEHGRIDNVVSVLDKISAMAVRRLKVDADSGNMEAIGEEEIVFLRSIIINHADVFDALGCNIQRQVKGWETYDSSVAITVRRDDSVDVDSSEEEDNRVLSLIQRNIQLGHLDAMKKCLKDGDHDGAVSRIRFLHLNYGVEETEYRAVFEDLLKGLLSRKGDFGDSWHAVRGKLLFLFGEALSSNCGDLVKLIQVLHDDLLLQENQKCGFLDNNQVLAPLQWLQKYHADLKLDTNIDDKSSRLNDALNSCIRDVYQYARVSGLHVLGCIMETALSAVKREQLEEANNVLTLFPRLRPLVASMGWDLLSGKTAMRRKMMRLLWTSNSRVIRLEESSLYENQSDEISCVEHLCHSLCYHLDIAAFVACVNSGQSWPKNSALMMSGNEEVAFEKEDASSDPFVENFVLERLSVQSPLRVLFDVVPGITYKDAIALISMQPIASSVEAVKRMHDIELMHMFYALESIVLGLGAIEKTTTDEKDGNRHMALSHLKDLSDHLEAVTNIPRKILTVNVIISLLHMDGIYVQSTHGASPSSFSESPSASTSEDGNKIVISFTGQLLSILRHNMPSTIIEQENAFSGALDVEGRRALEWRISVSQRFIEDWDWRLSVLQHFLPLSERQWSWKEALSVLRAAPSKLLNLCMQKAKYDIGGEAVHRFSLSVEDRATLELAEWVDSAFGTTSSVEDVISRAADETSAVQDLNLSSLRSELGSVAAILLCIDVAAASARSPKICLQLLDQAQNMLSEIYPGGSPKEGTTYWDQSHEIGIISVSRRVLKRLHEFLEQDNALALPARMAGDIITSSVKESQRQEQRERALAMLHQMIEDAHMGKRQFLSGKLHNLARAVADEESDVNFSKGYYTDPNVSSNFDKDGVIGYGLKVMKQTPISSVAGDITMPPLGYDMKDTGKRLYGPLSTKPTTYLSQFVLHIAAIGDIVDGTDTTHDFNFFSVIYEWPKDLLTRLVFDRGSTDAAGKVAEIMSADFVHEVISACVPPVYPPRSGDGWACIPVAPTCPRSSSENKVLSPSSKEAKPNSYIRSSATSGVPLYPLQLDIVKHLVKTSPVRAVLACVFGSSILYSGSGSDSTISGSMNESNHAPDADRLFYEFALDQSERFPTLNRWIQMQTNLHRVSEFAVTAERKADEAKPEARTVIKRLREHGSDSESEGDDIAGSSISSLLTDSSAQDVAPSDPKLTESDSTTVFLSFDWDNEAPYEKAVERLIGERKLTDALALSDRFLRNGASDQLLQLLIECGEENFSFSGQSDAYGGHNLWSNCWQYCLRLKDKHLAALLALEYMHRWELEAALDVLTMCSCHLLEGDPIRSEVLQKRQALQKYNHILCVDDHYSSWQEVEAECKEDPEGLALRLAGKGAVSAALEVAESAGLSLDLRRELQGRQLVKLLTADPLNGGGPAEASRFLSSLRDSNDALAVAMGAMQLLPNLRTKQLLVHFFLKRKDGNLSDDEVLRLNSWALGLRVLAALPLPWQQRCSSLHEHPHLILEVLLMRKQLQSASLILKEFPSMRDNDLIMSYAAKAIAVTISSPPREPRISHSGTRVKQKTRAGVPIKPSFTSSLSNLQKEARRAFSWAPRNTGDRTAPKDVYRKRKSSGLTASERVAWEAMTGIQENHVSLYSADGQERLPSVAIADEWMLTGDASKDEAVRLSHKYESSPDIILFKALLLLCSDELVSAKGALDLCVNQMKNVLSSQHFPENTSVETVGRAYHATETFVQGLLFAKSLLRKLAGGTDLSSNSERSKDIDDASSDAGSSSVGNQSMDEPSQVFSQADIWLGRAELLQSLLGSGIAVSLDDIANKESSACLRDRLILEERYSMAVYTCKKCKIDVSPVWKAWGHALLRMERYTQARVKFKQALQFYQTGDIPGFALDIINTIEGGPPVDVAGVRSMYDHLAKSAPTILDDSLSADSYLNVLYMPTTFPRSEGSRRFQESSNSNSKYDSGFDEGPRSNLDGTRYSECVNYLQEYARQHLLGFMFRHGHYSDACMLFFPVTGVPSSPQPSSTGTVSSSSSPQRPDPLAMDYGNIETLCELCIAYGAMSILEEIIAERISSQQDLGVNQYITAAISRICVYCETHKHFNYLYKFLVLKKDHVAAGLCCIQLFMNSFTQDEAVRHLDHAKIHFDEGLSARHSGGGSSRLVTKGIRKKGASAKLSEEDLVKLSARVSLQIEVVKSYNDSEAPQWKHSLFGNPNDPETLRRRCEIAETLVEKSFELGFLVISQFSLQGVDIYAAVAASLAERKRGSQLTEFFRNIKFLSDDDRDQVLGAAINVYANKHKERPDRLIDMLARSHSKVLACVVCGRLKSAFQIASKSGSVADVQYVAHQALHANSLPVLDMCKQWLAQYM